MGPGDLDRYVTLADPRLHPDGHRVIVVATRTDLEDDRYDRRLFLADGDDLRPFTHGPSDSSPRWSPDGRRLAFLRGSEDSDPPQVAVMPADGGEAVERTDFPLGARELAWSPDGTRLVVVGTSWIDGLADLDDDERKRRPRRITRMPYRADDEGWTHDRRQHLWLVDPDGDADAELLTPGDFDEWGPTFRPDGEAIAFLSRRHDGRQLDAQDQAFELDLASRQVRPLTDPGMWDDVRYGADGTVHVSGLPSDLDWPAMTGVHRVTDAGLEDVTGALDRGLALPPRILDDGTVVAAVEDRGRVHVVAFDGDGHRTLVDGDREVGGLSVSPDGRTVAVTVSAPHEPGRLVVVRDGEEHPVADLNAGVADELELHAVHHFTFERDGAELDAWALVPDGEDVPLLLNIHGGPTAQYGFGFFDEFQVYASAGYAVVGINPRGSSGRGTEFARAVVGAWTDLESVDMLDLRAAVDAVQQRFPTISRDRVGIMGGSYGGFATTRILAQDDRFRCAVVERGLIAWHSFAGTSDIGNYFDRMFFGASFDEDPEEFWLASPLAVASRITTPTLIVHSDDDLRCPIEQAEQLYATLVRAGTETEFVVFPGGSHELSRSGKPKHRKERFEVIVEWHDRHLRGDAAD